MEAPFSSFSFSVRRGTGGGAAFLPRPSTLSSALGGSLLSLSLVFSFLTVSPELSTLLLQGGGLISDPEVPSAGERLEFQQMIAYPLEERWASASTGNHRANYNARK